MYLKQLFSGSKTWFVIILIFIAIQVINNIRQDIAISPIYQYGMYSSHIPPKQYYDVYLVRVNGVILRPENFSPQQWDKIMLPLRYYATSVCNNDSMYERDIRRLLSRLLIKTDASNFKYPFNEQQFAGWYRNYLSGITGYDTRSIDVVRNIYRFDSSFSKVQTFPFGNLCR